MEQRLYERAPSSSQTPYHQSSTTQPVDTPSSSTQEPNSREFPHTVKDANWFLFFQQHDCISGRISLEKLSGLMETWEKKFEAMKNQVVVMEYLINTG
jgi:hypothetical protein